MVAMRSTALLTLLAFLPLAGATDRFPVPPIPEDLAVPPAGAGTTASGLTSRVLTAGSGQKGPGAEDLVTLEYTIWDKDGKVLDTTAHLARPFTRPLNRLLPGMREGLRLMAPGEKRRLWVPQALGFAGAAGRPTGTLVMDLELVATEPSPFLAPPDLAAPSEDARLLPSGMSMRILRPGKGGARPSRDSEVTVHYSGWTADGVLFDSSWKKAQPLSIRLDQVIKGWTEGVQLMVPGEKARFWVPEKMAYHGTRGMPAGMLVFDIELLEFSK